MSPTEFSEHLAKLPGSTTTDPHLGFSQQANLTDLTKKIYYLGLLSDARIYVLFIKYLTPATAWSRNPLLDLSDLTELLFGKN